MAKRSDFFMCVNVEQKAGAGIEGAATLRRFFG